MKNINIKAFVYIIVFVSGALWLGIATLSGVELSRLRDFALILPRGSYNRSFFDCTLSKMGLETEMAAELACTIS